MIKIILNWFETILSIVNVKFVYNQFFFGIFLSRNDYIPTRLVLNYVMQTIIL